MMADTRGREVWEDEVELLVAALVLTQFLSDRADGTHKRNMKKLDVMVRCFERINASSIIFYDYY